MLLRCTWKMKVRVNKIFLSFKLYPCCWNYILVDEIIEGMSIKWFKTLSKSKFFLERTLDWNKFYSLNALTDLIVGMWSISRVPFITKHWHLSSAASHEDESKRSSLLSPTKVSKREHLVPTRIYGWAIQRDEKYQTRDARI